MIAQTKFDNRQQSIEKALNLFLFSLAQATIWSHFEHYKSRENRMNPLNENLVRR